MQGAPSYCRLPPLTGHSIERTRGILEVYLPRTAKMAARGVARMARIGVTVAMDEFEKKEQR